MKKRLLFIAIGAFALAQLAQPDRNVPVTDPMVDMLNMEQPPADIQQMIIGACYDCHSYRTNYPVWAYITPVNFWIQKHIDEGRRKVNYSRWDLYAGNEEAGESGASINEGEMPPANYAGMHGHAQLSPAQKQQLAAWFDANVRSVVKDTGTRGAERTGSVEEDD